MFARGVFSFYPASIPASPENSPSPIIPTLAHSLRKLNHYYHLCETGGGGVPVSLSGQFASPLSLLFPQHPKFPRATPLFPLDTQKQGGTPPVENVGAPTFLIFPLIF
jgi:hypothetical protein